jgi:hypothetical protein
MKKAILTVLLVAFGSSAFAVMGFLKNQKINGLLKYCYYSNGVITTINSYELCPQSVN